MVQFLSINFFSWISSIFVGFFKSSRFFCVTLYYPFSPVLVNPPPNLLSGYTVQEIMKHLFIQMLHNLPCEVSPC